MRGATVQPLSRRAKGRRPPCAPPACVLADIGVSNFGTAELRELQAAFPHAPPVTLQSKFSPYHRGRTGNKSTAQLA